MPFKLTFLPPSPLLAHDVLSYVTRRRDPDTPRTASNRVLRFPANMYSGLTIVHRGELRDPERGTRTPGVALSGAMTRAVWREYVDLPETTVVVFKPGRLTDFCRLPAHELTDHWADASAILPRADLLEITDRMASQQTVARQIMVLEEVLERRLARRASSPSLALARAIRAIVWKLPHMKVDALADHLGLGVRRLGRRFDATFGVSPRMMIRLARLQLSLWHLQRMSSTGGRGLTDIAFAAGFADASHLAREIHAFTGQTPSALLQAMKPPADANWSLAARQDALSPIDGDAPLR
jgi:AraC-like DNA-binding protein